MFYSCPKKQFVLRLIKTSSYIVFVVPQSALFDVHRAFDSVTLGTKRDHKQNLQASFIEIKLLFHYSAASLCTFSLLSILILSLSLLSRSENLRAGRIASLWLPRALIFYSVLNVILLGLVFLLLSVRRLAWNPTVLVRNENWRKTCFLHTFKWRRHLIGNHKIIGIRWLEVFAQCSHY